MIDTKHFFRAKGKRRFFKQLISSEQRKHLGWWFRSLQTNYLMRKPLLWLCFDAIEFVLPRLTPGMRVFEYGSGGSTLFWLSRGAQVVSVEHDSVWYEVLAAQLAETNEASARTIDYRLVPPECGAEDQALTPESAMYGSTLPEYAGCHFMRYCRQIDEFADESFDVVLVDGRARNACIRHAQRKVKRGGMLILDNSERPYYLEGVDDFLQEYTRYTFSGATPAAYIFSESSVFVRHS